MPYKQLKDLQAGELGKLLATGESLQKEEQPTELGKLLKEQLPSDEILKARQRYFGKE